MTNTVSVTSPTPEVAIIGFGVAGFNAAVGLRLGGYQGVIRVYSDHGSLPYSPIMTSHYASGHRMKEHCYPWSAEEIADLNLFWMKDCRVDRLDTVNKVVHTADGDYPYTACVLASGATPVANGFPTDSYEPYMLRTMEDAERLRTMLADGTRQNILVSGASMVALKMVEAALEQNKTVTIVGMNPHLLDFSALPEAAIRFERGMLDKGVTLRLSQTISSVELIPNDGPLGRSLKVTFSTGDVVEYDEICVAHGMKCNLDYLEDGALAMDRGVLVDDNMRTSDPAVFAAGDIAQATELVTGEKRIIGLWKTAAIQGMCAGRTIAAELLGQPLPAAAQYRHAMPANTINVCGTQFISGGTMDTSGNRSVEIREDDEMTVIYIWDHSLADTPVLVGFNITADHNEPGGRALDTGAMLSLRIEEAFR